MTTAAPRVPGALQGHFLVTPPGIFLLIALYIALHFAIRFLVGPTLGFDDSEQAMVGQHLAMGYRFRQPPLYTWITWASLQVFGVTLFAVTLVHYGILALGYLFLYLAARRLTGDDLRAALILFSFALIYVFAYYALHDLTHTVLIATLIAASLYFLIGAVQRGRWPDFLLFGLTLGLGALSKYNFLIYAASALAAAAVVPEMRRRLFGLKLLAALALGAAVAAPYWIWAMTAGHSLFGLTSKVVATESAGDLADWIGGRLEGLLRLALAALEFPFPFLIVLAVLLPELLLRRATAADPYGLRRFLAWQILFAMGVMLVAVLVFGASQFKARWFHPILMALPFFLFSRFQAADLPRRRVKLFIAAAAAVTLLAMGGRFLEDRLREAYCHYCRAHWPIAEAAERLAEAGFRRGTILAQDHHLGGNLFLAFPDSRILDPAFPFGAFPPDPVAEQCLVVWDEERPLLPDNMARYLAQNLDAELGERERDGLVTAPFGPEGERRYSLSYILIEGGMGDCR